MCCQTPELPTTTIQLSEEFWESPSEEKIIGSRCVENNWRELGLDYKMCTCVVTDIEATIWRLQESLSVCQFCIG